MAKKKNAPVLKNNLRNAPAEKFRAVNRMNGIITMVEYTGEDDIKAYELEPNYRELGGGSGGSILPLLTVKLTTNGEYFLGGETLPIIENNLVTPGVVSVANTETIYKFLPIPMNDGGNLIAGAVINSVENAIISAGWQTGTNVINTSDEVNCQVMEPDPGWKTIVITDIHSPASITINFSHNE